MTPEPAPLTRPQPDRLLTEKQAAARLGLSRSFLQCTRVGRRTNGPPFVKVGARGIRYRESSLTAWITARETPAGRPA